jgi:uncharacterized protein (DUF924 family)
VNAIAYPKDVLAFWRGTGPAKWFAKDDAFDAAIREKFLATYEAAAAGSLSAWEATPEGTLALVIVLDQFPRNMFRGDARTYAADPFARAVADRALGRGIDRDMVLTDRQFLYLPFEHSEHLADQERACALFRATGDGELIKWAELHIEIIRRFGRFPHRNKALGRASTVDEQVFLERGGFAG